MGHPFSLFPRRKGPGPPRGIQLRRTAGWTLQTASHNANGREAVKVDRATPWGNPYAVTPDRSAADCVNAFEITLLTWTPEKLEEYLAPLRGKNLACWCAIGKPCHRDVLLRLANREGRP